jgi:hypothetical protein
VRRIGLILGSIVCAAASVAADPPKPLAILADDVDYKASKVTETIHEGILERTPSKGTLGGPSRFNPYRLSSQDGAGKPVVRELFVATKAPLLAVHVGQRVRVVGKLIEVETDGAKRLELWAAKLSAVSEALADAPGEDGVYARTTWQPGSDRKLAFRFAVFRDGTQLARDMKLTGTTVGDTATTMAARQLHVPTVDWTKHMVVSISGGLLRGKDADLLTVTRVTVDDDKMTIYYKMTVRGPGPASGFGDPAETVLINRFAGTVRVEEEKTPPTARP